MERLTVKLNGTYEIKGIEDVPCGDVCERNHGCETCKIHEAVEKLAEYEDAEEQEMLIRLPCKVGDTVYVLTPKKNDYIETDVKRIVVYDNDIEIVTCICVRSIKEIGKTVFFTREQAEKKINEQKEL